eukprot:TRINITY_DN2695_c0_g1_i1.p2 TRINITY_DN2695_c0_g1~~TRINITY_DN2695_c0_g1_i1.p2  ORF type:complete len:200 (+),score=50.96 TRINITY_DN2695_c0_g1_i1:68-667(+)
MCIRDSLYAFKRYDPTLYAMVPGWSPQIGGLTKNAQKKYLGNKDQFDQGLSSKSVLISNKGQNQEIPQNLNQSINNVVQNNNYQLQNQQMSNQVQSTKNIENKRFDFAKYYDQQPIANNNNTERIETKPNTNNIFYNETKGKAYFLHNPIVNPMPANIQNPYILKNIYQNNPVKPTIFQTVGSNLTHPSQLYIGAFQRK